MKQIILGLALLMTANTYASNTSKKFWCYSDKSLVSDIYETLRNTIRFGGNVGYYTSAIQFELTEVNPNEYTYAFFGRAAFCKKDEQCEGLYKIYSGTAKTIEQNDKILSDSDKYVDFEVDLKTKECKAKILDFIINKKLRKFKGEF